MPDIFDIQLDCRVGNQMARDNKLYSSVGDIIYTHYVYDLYDYMYHKISVSYKIMLSSGLANLVRVESRANLSSLKVGCYIAPLLAIS